MKLDYLITGTGRCGTVFLARLLTTAGVPCGHETFFDFKGLDTALARLNGEKKFRLSLVSCTEMKSDGSRNAIDDWVNVPAITSESSYLAAPHLDHEILSDTKFIHVVRNPIRVVNSFVNSLGYFTFKNLENKVFEDYICQFTPELRENLSQEERACLYYILWNEMIESKLKDKKFLHYRIEDDIQPVLDFIEKPRTNKLHSNVETNTMLKRGEKRFQINQLQEGPIKNRFIEIGKRYGYEMSSEYLVI